MSELNILWRKYRLVDDPYFISPLSIANDKVPLSVFTGRKNETKRLIDLIASGNERIMVIGEAGIGKTSFVNYVRARAREGKFFSPSSEIEINNIMSGQQFLITTINALYQEILTKNLTLSDELKDDLDKIYSLGGIVTERNEVLNLLSFHRLKELFIKFISEIVKPRYKGVILHYDNLDNIEEIEKVPHMFGEIRDILLTNNVTFIFVGNHFLPEEIGYAQRVRQIFYFPPIEINKLSFNEIKIILQKRVECLKIDEIQQIETPHTEDALKILFDLYNGNIRHILKSLSDCAKELASSNNPIKIDGNLLREVLSEKVRKDFFDGLTKTERDILLKMLEVGKPITPTDVAQITRKKLTNISSLYLPKLRKKTAIEFVGKEGRNVYYEVRPEIKWALLESKDKEKVDKAKDFITKRLTDYLE